MCKQVKKAELAWWVVGGLFALTAFVIVVREIPAMRREMKILSM